MKFTVLTKGHCDFIDITAQIEAIVEKSELNQGLVNIFAVGSTNGLTTIEYENGLLKDLKNVFEKIAPEKADYEHHLKWNDKNGAAHILSSLLKTDLTIPFEQNKLCLGTWQQIVLIDFDERPRQREIIVQIVPSIKTEHA